MSEIHCHRCGGFIGNLAGTRYREASTATPPVAAHGALSLGWRGKTRDVTDGRSVVALLRSRRSNNCPIHTSLSSLSRTAAGMARLLDRGDADD